MSEFLEGPWATDSWRLASSLAGEFDCVNSWKTLYFDILDSGRLYSGAPYTRHPNMFLRADCIIPLLVHYELSTMNLPDSPGRIVIHGRMRERARYSHGVAIERFRKLDRFDPANTLEQKFAIFSAHPAVQAHIQKFPSNYGSLASDPSA
jgi:hypothetical protein